MTILPRSSVFSSGVARARDEHSDREQFADLVAGRPEALGAVYDRHAGSLFRHALALTRQRADAEDLVQAVFVKVATTGAELLNVRTPAGYLHRMLHTTWLDGHRRKATGERVGEIVAAESQAAPADATDALDITRALGHLPAEQREVVVLHAIEGFSFREVGRLTGVSLFTAAARYRLAIARLRKAMGPKGDHR